MGREMGWGEKWDGERIENGKEMEVVVRRGDTEQGTRNRDRGCGRR
jgi:hypothetical protein